MPGVGDAAVAAAEGAADQPRAAGIGGGWFGTIARMAIMWMIMGYFKSKPAPANPATPGDPTPKAHFTSPAFDKGAHLNMYVPIFYISSSQCRDKCIKFFITMQIYVFSCMHACTHSRYAFMSERPHISRYDAADLVWSETGYALGTPETRQYSFTYEPSQVTCCFLVFVYNTGFTTWMPYIEILQFANILFLNRLFKQTGQFICTSCLPKLAILFTPMNPITMRIWSLDWCTVSDK